MARRTRRKAPKAHCCGAELPPWRVDVEDGDYKIPPNTLVTLSKIGSKPNDKYKLKFKAPTGPNPCPQLKSMTMIPVAVKPPQEISAKALDAMVAGWSGDYLKACYEVIRSGYNYRIGVARAGQVPTLALFIQSKYSGNPGQCRRFALVLKKLDEIGGKPHVLQGGVLHGGEN
jgi:hypothetical protein